MPMDASGLTIPRLAEIREAIRAAIVADSDLGPSVQTAADTILGQLVDIFAEREALVWEAVQSAYDAYDPDSAGGSSLEAICAYAGVTRLAASHSTVTLTATGTNGTVIPEGSIFRVPNGGKWVSIAEATISGGEAAVVCEAEDTGPIEAEADTITGIVTTISGLTSVTNEDPAVPGRTVETDAQLRVRREISLQRASGSTPAAIRARVLEVEDVLACVVIDNDSDALDLTYSLPAHSFRVVVWPDLPNNTDIWQAIWEHKPGGIYSDGFYAGLATDTQGVQHQLRYSTASEQEIHVVVRVVVDPDNYPLDGDDQVEAAVLAYGAALSIGDDVRPFKASAAIDAAVSGILDLEVRAKIGSTPGGSDTVTIPISIVQIATMESANITVTQVSNI